jgi:hypothetical protein
MEPELEDERALVGKHFLEAYDLVQRLGQPFVLDLAVGALDDGVGIPGAEVDTDLAFRRQGTPVAPHVGALGFLVRWRAESMRMDVSRVHPFVEQVGGFALAGAIDTADEDDDGKFLRLGQVVLGVEQGLAQGGHFVFVGLLVYGMAEFGRFEHGVSF